MMWRVLLWPRPEAYVVLAAGVLWLAAEVGRWIYDPYFWFPWE